MIDLTPLDVRNKRGDFKKLLRGYDPQEVDVFLELVAERLEDLVRENIQLRERSETLQEQVSSQSGRERAVQEALVTAQELRNEMKSHAERQADLVLAEAQAEARRQLAEAEAEIRTRFRDAERRMEQAQDALVDMERRRTRFLKSFRQLLEREMDVVEVEEGRPPLEDRPIDLDLGGGFGGSDESVSREPSPEFPGEPAGAVESQSTPDVLAEPMESPQELNGGSVEPLRSLDATVDDLAAEYRDVGGALFDAVPPASHDTEEGGEQDLFSTAEEPDNDDEDSRWG